MGPINIALWLVGAALMIYGYTRARGPWVRYQALREQDANVARYESWRGGARRDDGSSGASVAMVMLRRQAQRAGLIAVAGFVMVFLGFLIR